MYARVARAYECMLDRHVELSMVDMLAPVGEDEAKRRSVALKTSPRPWREQTASRAGQAGSGDRQIGHAANTRAE